MTGVPHIFDRELYLSRQARASGEALALLDGRIAAELADRIAVINRRFGEALLIAVRLSSFREVIEGSGKVAHLAGHPPPEGADLNLPAEAFDAIFSLLDLQSVDDVPGYLAQVAAALRPDGLAIFAFFAGDTLTELRQAWLAAETEMTGGVSPRVAPMIDLREAGGLLQRAGLALPVSDLDRLALRYADPFALMREIKALGFSNHLIGRSNRPVTRALLLKAAEAYRRDCSDADGRIRATVDVAWAMAWKPHPSQQKPLRPGSAKARLADALKVRDQPEDQA